MNYTVTAFAENKPGVLYRIADLFLRRKINIESMTVSETERKGVSRFTIVVNTNKDIVEKICKQLYRIIEVIKVFESEDKDLIYKEIALIKVHARNLSARKEIENFVKLSGGKIILINKNSLIIEKVGSEEDINNLYSLLISFGIKEFVRSGRIAVIK